MRTHAINRIIADLARHHHGLIWLRLAEPLGVARDAGALGVVVSGSGPTVAALGRSRQHALVLAAAFTASGAADRVLTATGPVAGARVVSTSD